MTDKPISVAIAIVLHEKNILLISRPDGNYKGLWSLPGGKIEVAEHVGEAAVREILEETGLRTTFTEYAGIVSEHLMENGNVAKHFLLHICILTPANTSIVQQEGEGEPRWFELAELTRIREDIIPSDFAMIEHFVQQKNPKHYIECIIEKNGERHELRKFG